MEFESYEQLADHYKAGKLHAMDLKGAIAIYINELIKPVRNHFEKNKTARELKKQVDSFQITR